MTNTTALKAPFPYFGGKSKIASVVWQALGADVKNYVEPFFGSGAVLLNRPGGPGHTETVNDADGLLSNAWRAMQAAPDAVADAADWPVNEADLHARHYWLVQNRGWITEQLMGDPAWYDIKAAGWWVWGTCAWIGGGWCVGKGPWVSVDGVLVDKRKLPHLGAGMGITRKLPHLGAGRGINRQIPHLGDAGMGMTRSEYIREMFAAVSARLRDTRVACGDFERVLSSSVTTRHGMTGVFLDPPYDAGNTDPYGVGSTKGVAGRALAWATANGNDPLLRIVLAGYSGEHDSLEALGWKVHAWKANGGYAVKAGGSGQANAASERLWLSPGCLPIEALKAA